MKVNWIQGGIPEEVQGLQWLKRCDYNSQDEPVAANSKANMKSVDSMKYCWLSLDVM